MTCAMPSGSCVLQRSGSGQACRLLIFLTAGHCVQLTPVATLVASCRLLVSSRQTGACWGDGALEAALGRRLDILGWSRN